MSLKLCKKCGQIKYTECFGKLKESKDGLQYSCRACNNEQKKIYYHNNIERYREISRVSADKQYKRNPSLFRDRHKTWIKENRDIYIESKKKSDKKYSNTFQGIEVHNRARLKWKINNPEKDKESKKKWAKDNYNYYTDIRFRLKHSVGSSIRGRIKRRLRFPNKSISSLSYLPYTIDNLIKHLESKFEPWMNWNNYGFGAGKWTIDHIRPDSSFNYKSVEDEEFQKCWALSNLQPLEFTENCSKNDKYNPEELNK